MKYICTECPNLRRNICNYHDGSCRLEEYYMEILPKTSPRWCPLKKLDKKSGNGGTENDK